MSLPLLVTDSCRHVSGPVSKKWKEGRRISRNTRRTMKVFGLALLLPQTYTLQHLVYHRSPNLFFLPTETTNIVHFFAFMWPCIVTNVFIIRTIRCTNLANFIFGMKLYMFWTVPLSIIRSSFTVQSVIVYVIQVCRQLRSSKAVYKPIWHIPLLSVQWINSWWWT
jgi:hypothetical protein